MNTEGKYLSQFLEPENDRSFDFDPPLVNPDLAWPSAKIDFSESASETFRIGDVEINLTYCMPTAENVSLAAIKQLERFQQTKYYRAITAMSISLPGLDQTMEVRSFVPDGVNFLFRIRPAIGERQIYNYNNERGTISAGSDLNTPEGVLSLLHEIGHARIDRLGEGHIAKDALEESLYYNDDIGTELQVPNDVLRTMLLNERIAWAFALKKISPFLNSNPDSPFNRTRVRQYMHEWLSSYTNKMRRNLRQNETEQNRSADLSKAEEISKEVQGM